MIQIRSCYLHVFIVFKSISPETAGKRRIQNAVLTDSQLQHVVWVSLCAGEYSTIQNTVFTDSQLQHVVVGCLYVQKNTVQYSVQYSLTVNCSML